jgi:hypothetical protein
MYGIPVGMMPLFCDLIGNIMNVDDKVDERDDHGDENTECYIVKCAWIDS